MSDAGKPGKCLWVNSYACEEWYIVKYHIQAYRFCNLPEMLIDLFLIRFVEIRSDHHNGLKPYFLCFPGQTNSFQGRNTTHSGNKRYILSKGIHHCIKQGSPFVECPGRKFAGCAAQDECMGTACRG